MSNSLLAPHIGVGLALDTVSHSLVKTASNRYWLVYRDDLVDKMFW